MKTQSGYSFPSDSKRISVQGGWQSYKGNNDERDSCQMELVFQCNSLVMSTFFPLGFFDDN